MYEFCGDALMELPSADLTRADRRKLRSAMRKAGHTHDMGERAWIMRRAFDQMLDRMETASVN